MVGYLSLIHIYQSILELRGPKEAEFYQFIHGGYRSAVGLIASAGFSFMGMIMTLQGSSDGLILSGAAVAFFIAGPFLVDSDVYKRQIQEFGHGYMIMMSDRRHIPIAKIKHGMVKKAYFEYMKADVFEKKTDVYKRQDFASRTTSVSD